MEEDLTFPNYADEERMVSVFTVTEITIIVGSVLFFLLVREFIIALAIGFILWNAYQLFKENSSSNVLMQLAYKFGLYIPKSHLFPAPNVKEFRE